VAGLGEGAQVPSLFWVKKEEMTEGRKAGRASKSKLTPPPPPPPPHLHSLPPSPLDLITLRPVFFLNHNAYHTIK